MPITINGSGTLTGVSVGGLPDGIVDTDMVADDAVTAPKIGAKVFTSLAVLEDQQSTGTEGGSSVSGSWVHRTLETEVYDPDSIVTLSGSQFTIGPGNFFIYFESQSYQSGRNQNRLYNVTDTAAVKYGNNAYGSGGEGVTNVSWGWGRVTISSGTKTYRVEHRVESSMSTYGWGVAFSSGGGNIYTRVVIYKEA